MRLTGFWRLMIALYAVATLFAFGSTHSPEWDCAERRARWEKAGSVAADYPYCRTVTEYATEVGMTLGAFAVIILGPGLVVRWVYRGFKRQP